jgi:hypothetical protein
MIDFTTLWDSAYSFDAFLAGSTEHRGLWEGIHRLARVPDWAPAAVPIGARRKLLVIAEDWCGDASNTIPILDRLTKLTPGLEMRIVRRDQHPELMDRYLTNGSRSIPIVIVLDEELREIGHWGPRPAVLQSWVMANRLTTPKAELYPQVRKWYARDHGETTIREVLETAGFPVARVA